MIQCKLRKILFVLCLICAFALSLNIIQLGRADYITGSTIYIRADGSIYPVGAPITTSDQITYTLTGNIVSTGTGGTVIVIQRSNIILDGAGYSLTGPGGGGVQTGFRLAVQDLTVLLSEI